ncbi:hypothetical protein ACQCN2_10025 [Brevibacillus ginsengisoli]|uniref:hypothetical protein n=1 Tax=Brevibacillus ginsengisoli TaxID=363854 RepID=UPI003CF924F9
MAKGDTSATFDFATALSADPTGKWTINGTTFDFANIQKLSDILTAVGNNNEVATLAALKAAGLANIKDENITTYVAAIKTATAKDTLADIQTIINTSNDSAISSADAKVIVDAVNAATNQVQLLAALQNKAFARVNPDWIVDYKTAIDAAVATGKDSIVEIQALVDGKNSTKITAADTAAATSVDQNAVTALIQTYVAADVAPATTKADQIKASQIKTGVFKVKEASTQTSVYSALTGLAALDSTDLPATALNSTLKADYLTAQTANKATITGATTPAQIKTMIVDAADTSALNAALAGVKGLTNTSTDADVKAALQKLANVTSHKTGTDKFDMTTVKDASLQTYVNAATVGFVAAGADGLTLAEVQTAISTVNATANVAADLATVNSTTATAADVRSALIDIALVQNQAGSKATVDAFINLPTQAQLEIAQLVIDTRPAAGYADLEAIVKVADGTGAIATEQKAHADQFAKFNAIGDLASATTTSIKTALDTYAFDGYANLTNTQKVAVAQQVAKLTKTVNGTVTPLNFAGTDAVKTLKEANDIITAAIKAAGL